MDYHREHNLQIKIVRIFNTYGPNMSRNDGRVVSNFITQAIAGNELTVYGDGNQTRSFQYIDDLVKALIMIMGTDKNFTGPINIGNNEEISMNELAKLVIKLTNSSSKISYNELPKDDPVRRKPNIELAKSIISWEPKVQIEDGLNQTIDYFKKL